MESLVPIGIWAVVAMVGLGILAIIMFGVRSLMYGKVDKLTIAFVSLPIVLLGAMGLAMGDWTRAAMFTLFIMIGLAIVAMLITSVKGVFR